MYTKGDMNYIIDKPLLRDLAQGIYGTVQHAMTGEPLTREKRIIECVDQFLDSTFRLLSRHPYVTPEERPVFELAVHLRILRESQDGNAQIIGLAYWARAGFPCVAMGHKFCSSLLVTTASEEAVDMARPPFDAFLIEVPEGVVWNRHPSTNEIDPIRFILVGRLANNKVPEGWAWMYVTYSSAGISLFRYGVRGRELLPAELDEVLTGAEKSGRTVERSRNNDHIEGLSFELTEEDKRMQALIGRLVVNSCLAFSDPTNVAERGRTKNRTGHKGKQRNASEPTVRNYFLGRPIEHDFRAVVRDYALGKRRSMTVQGMVRGHYKGQHHGPQNSLYKVIWREPFWRGPEDAPIPIRPIKVGDE